MLLPRNRLASAILLVVVAATAFAAQAAADVSVGQKAPDFKLDSVNSSAPVKLSNYTTKPTVLVFWVSWCSHCRRELPILQTLANDYKGKANVVGVSVDDSLKDARRVLSDKNITFPNAFAGTDAGMNVVRSYGINGVPAVFVIDKRGVVRAAYVGETDASDIRSDLAKLGVK